jgi:hypothetical protein
MPALDSLELVCSGWSRCNTAGQTRELLSVFAGLLRVDQRWISSGRAGSATTKVVIPLDRVRRQHSDRSVCRVCRYITHVRYVAGGYLRGGLLPFCEALGGVGR